MSTPLRFQLSIASLSALTLEFTLLFDNGTFILSRNFRLQKVGIMGRHRLCRFEKPSVGDWIVTPDSVLAVGPVRAVRSETRQYMPDWRAGADYRNDLSVKKELVDNALLELSHKIDLLRWIFSDVDWIGAWINHQSTLEIDVEDCARLTMGFANGPVEQLNMNFMSRNTIAEGGQA